MKTPSHSWLLPCVLGGLVLATPALAQNDEDPYAYPDEQEEPEERGTRRRRAAQDDAPIAYPDDDDTPTYTPGRKRPLRPTDDMDREFRNMDDEEDEAKKKFRYLAGMDDPNTGVAFEVLGGALFQSSARGAFLGDLRPAIGGRFTWEYGRLLNVESLREALWFDVRYMFSGAREGTQLIVGQTQVHYATIAPAYELTFGEGSDYGVYGQLGGGIAYTQTLLEIGGQKTPVDGIKPLIQYGVGLRGRTKLSSENNLRLSWRVELMRFRRGYLDDNYVGASVGTAF